LDRFNNSSDPLNAQVNHHKALLGRQPQH
jgi:hypothetical protein